MTPGPFPEFWVGPGDEASYSQLRAHNKKWGEEEHVTLVVAVVTAESPTCTINRASCFMPGPYGFTK